MSKNPTQDAFSCQCCGETTETLHVHHLDYKKSCDPWDYDDSELITIRNFFLNLAA